MQPLPDCENMDDSTFEGDGGYNTSSAGLLYDLSGGSYTSIQPDCLTDHAFVDMPLFCIERLCVAPGHESSSSSHEDPPAESTRTLGAGHNQELTDLAGRYNIVRHRLPTVACIDASTTAVTLQGRCHALGVLYLSHHFTMTSPKPIVSSLQHGLRR